MPNALTRLLDRRCRYKQRQLYLFLREKYKPCPYSNAEISPWLTEGSPQYVHVVFAQFYSVNIVSTLRCVHQSLRVQVIGAKSKRKQESNGINPNTWPFPTRKVQNRNGSGSFESHCTFLAGVGLEHALPSLYLHELLSG